MEDRANGKVTRFNEDATQRRAFDSQQVARQEQVTRQAPGIVDDHSNNDEVSRKSCLLRRNVMGWPLRIYVFSLAILIIVLF